MKYKIQITEIACEQIDDAYAWFMERTPLHAWSWHEGLLEAIDSLGNNPLRCPLISDAEDSSGEIRQLLYGNKQHAYRIIYFVGADSVTILQVRHAARE